VQTEHAAFVVFASLLFVLALGAATVITRVGAVLQALVP
jgi:hypothetical protein